MRTFWLTISILLSLVFSTQAKTLEELSLGARYFCEEETAYYFTSSEVYLFVNMAQNEVANAVADEALNDLSDRETKSVSLTTLTNTLPTNYIRIQNVFLNGYVCKKTTPDEMWELSPLNPTGKIPTNKVPRYVLADGGIMIYPQQTVAGTYEIYFIKKPTELTTTSQECDYTPQVENLVILQTAIYMLKKDHEDAKAAQLQAQMDREVSVLNSRYGVTIKP